MQQRYERHLADAKSALCQARTALSQEIRSYPTPISGCDAQFNHLLAERHRIAAALKELDERIFIPTPRTPSLNACVESR